MRLYSTRALLHTPRLKVKRLSLRNAFLLLRLPHDPRAHLIKLCDKGTQARIFPLIMARRLGHLIQLLQYLLDGRCRCLRIKRLNLL